MEKVFSAKRTALDRLCIPMEQLLYRVCGIDPSREMTFSQYAISFVMFGLAGTLFLYAILRLQRVFPLVLPCSITTPVCRADLAMNTAISFSTTSTWQAYRRRKRR